MPMINIQLPPRDPEALKRVLRAIGKELRGCELERAKAPVNSNPFELCDQALLAMDGFLGAAFVSCQAYISTTIALTNALQGIAGAAKNLKKYELLRMNSPILTPTEFSRIQVIDAFANYFKHRDEWDPSWLQLDKQNRATAAIVGALGANGQTGENMLLGARALGVTDFEKLEELATELADWSFGVMDALRLQMNAAHREPA